MEYKNLEEINKTLKTIDVKGKNYVEVNQRLIAFWKLCPDGRISTDVLSYGNGVVVIQAKVFEDKKDENPRATGIAYEKEGSTFINKTSYIENCETSAIGRALGIAGIGIDTSVASAEEVQNAIIQQNDKPKTIDGTMEVSLREAITNKGISTGEVLKALEKVKCEKLSELTYENVHEFKKLLEL